MAKEEEIGRADDALGNLPARAFWQRRYYDFNVFREAKHMEKLRYMHRNPVKRGLVKSPELWRWSSFRAYWLGEEGPVKIGT
jgi:putative transposase